MKPNPWRMPIGVQIGAVVALFAAASAALWYTGTLVVEREERRAEARRRLAMASEALIVRGREGPAMAGIHRFPFFPEAAERQAIADELARKPAEVLADYPDVQGGYFLQFGPDEALFLPEPRVEVPASRSRPSPIPTAENDLADLIETQINAAVRKHREISVVEDLAPDHSVALRTASIWDDGSKFVAAWAMIRLADPVFLDRSVRGYRTSAGLALSGIALSLALTVNLTRTVRRQAAERGRLQAELRRNDRLAALGRLLAGVAHEVRNPLAGIRSTAQLWKRGIGRGPESEAGLLDEVDRLEGIVSRLLQFSRADAQDFAPGDLNVVVEEAARLAAVAAEPKGIAIDLDLAPGRLPAEMAPPALMQVFRNLTTNAIQVMPRGGRLRLATRLDPTGRSVEASVTDDGPGLKPEVLGHLFEPFFTTKAEGTGLGLAIAREIALAHRGELVAANRPDGPGAAFTLRLPLANRERR